MPVRDILGTTAASSAAWCIEAGRIAYSAPGGVVVASVSGSSKKTVVDKRFFATRYSELGPTFVHSGPDDSQDFTSTKTKSVVSVAMSADASMVAAGETGHRPRIFVFSTASPEPIAVILNEHRLSVKYLSFSPCGRFLASLGSSNDGFMHVWSLKRSVDGLKVQLRASNKCLSMVHGLKWIDSSTLVTVGVRHVRVWRVVEPTERGAANLAFIKNVILDQAVTLTFTCLCLTNESNGVRQCLVGAEDGTVSLIRIGEDTRLHPILSTGLLNMDGVDINSDKQLVVLANGQLHTFDIDLDAEPISPTRLTPSPTKPRSPVRSGSTPRKGGPADLQNDSQCKVPGLVVSDEYCAWLADNAIMYGSGQLVMSDSRLKGIATMNKDMFFTWSGSGLITKWSSASREWVQQLGQEFVDEDRELMVACCGLNQVIVTGDNMGTIYVYCPGSSEAQTIKAHGSRVTALSSSAFQEEHVVLSGGRDRAVQVFSSSVEGLALEQTVITAHKSAIISVQLSADHQRIVSYSVDRTVQVSRRVSESALVFAPERTITLRAMPTDMVLQGDRIIVACDRTVYSYRLDTGEQVGSFRSIEESGEAITLNSIRIHRTAKRTYLIGLGTSLNVYEYPSGVLVQSEGQLEASANHAHGLVCGDKEIMTRHEGCIFIWDGLSEDLAPLGVSSSTAAVSPFASPDPPMRRVLTKAELARLEGKPPLTVPSVRRRLTLGNSIKPLSLPPGSNQTRQQSRRVITPSKSLSDLKKDTVAAMPSNGTQRLRASPIPGSVTPRRNQVDDLCRSLEQFREFYRRASSTIGATKLDRLRTELQKTLELMETQSGSAKTDEQMERMLEQFSDRLVSIVADKMEGVKI